MYPSWGLERVAVGKRKRDSRPCLDVLARDTSRSVPLTAKRKVYLSFHPPPPTVQFMKRTLSPTATDNAQEKPAKMANTATDAAPPAPTSTLLIKRLSDKATLPKRGSALAAGYDLYR